MSPPKARPFYFTKGTLDRDAPCYIERRADQELFDQLDQGAYCYVLTTRQMGKSSLMARTAARLTRERDTKVALLDLSSIGQPPTPEQWYNGLLIKLAERFDLEDEIDELVPQGNLTPLMRWMRAVAEVFLPRCQGRLIIAIDEIDAVRSLPFSTDEFFAAIRECHNRRSTDPEFHRLSFCLLGVATPSDLIRDARTTPFNIGRRIDLGDFRLDEVTHLAQGLGRDEATARRLLERVYSWTNGHPYLTQTFCEALASRPEITSKAQVDRLCEELFLTAGARERDDNLIFVRKRILGVAVDPSGASPTPQAEVELANVLNTYARIRAGRPVRDDEPNPIVNVLCLSGIVRSEDGCLRVRNRIYERAFDPAWVRANMPGAEVRRQKAAFRRGLLRGAIIGTAALLMLLGAGAWYWDAFLRLKPAYYLTVVRRAGIPEGIGRLPSDAYRHRNATFRLVRRAGRVMRCEVVDASGHLTSRLNLVDYIAEREREGRGDGAKPCRWEFDRDAQGKLVLERAYDRAGRLAYALAYAPTDQPNVVVAHYIDMNTGLPLYRTGSTAAYVRVTRAGNGYDRELHYLDPSNQPAARYNAGREFGRRYERDSRGLPTSYTNLGRDGRPASYKDGCSRIESTYNGAGQELTELNRDLDGLPNAHHDGSCGIRESYDKWGRLVETIHVDASGRPACTKQGYCISKTNYDAAGNAKEISYFGEDGKLTNGPEAYARVQSTFDAQGNQTDADYFDESGTRTFHKEGYSRIHRKFDALGNVIEESYFDKNNDPIVAKVGCARRRFRYDATRTGRGNKLEESYFGPRGKPIRLGGGLRARDLGLRRARKPGGRSLLGTLGAAPAYERRLRPVASRV